MCMCMCMSHVMCICMSFISLCTHLGARRGTRLPKGTSVQQAARSRAAQPSAYSRRLNARADRPATIVASLALPAWAPAPAARLLCAASPLVLAGAQPRSRGGSRSRRGRRRWRARARARPKAILRDPPPVMAATSCGHRRGGTLAPSSHKTSSPKTARAWENENGATHTSLPKKDPAAYVPGIPMGQPKSAVAGRAFIVIYHSFFIKRAGYTFVNERTGRPTSHCLQALYL